MRAEEVAPILMWRRRHWWPKTVAHNSSYDSDSGQGKACGGGSSPPGVRIFVDAIGADGNGSADHWSAGNDEARSSGGSSSAGQTQVQRSGWWRSAPAITPAQHIDHEVFQVDTYLKPLRVIRPVLRVLGLDTMVLVATPSAGVSRGVERCDEVGGVLLRVR